MGTGHRRRDRGGTFGLAWNEINALEGRADSHFGQAETRLDGHGERLAHIGTS